LNNTDKNVLLLVGGEANKEDNKIVYSLHPERNELRRKRRTIGKITPKIPGPPCWSGP
jgi:uncharacterized cupin superfamily protein